MVVHGGAIGVAERGCLIADGYGKTEQGMGNGSVWNIARMSVGTDRRMTLDEVEVIVGGRGPMDGGWGSVATSANNVWGVIFVSVDVDGASDTSRRGISFGGYEERS